MNALLHSVTVEAVVAAMKAKGYAVFEGAKQPDLNVVGLRNPHGTLDAFDDAVCAFHRSILTGWAFYIWTATLDPGKPSIEKPTRSDGTAVMAVGQTRGAFTFGMHHGEYECLSPAVPIPVLRYKSAADYATGKGTPSTSSSTQIHHASSSHTSTVVGPWSEGCAVFASAVDFAELMKLCHKQTSAGLGDRFTWTVLEMAAQ